MTGRGMAAALGVVAVLATGCGSSSTLGSGAAGAPGASTSGPGSGHGTVSVLYAGSLVNLMERDLGPAFSRADGYGFEGLGAGSTALVQQIKDGIRQGDVFISASAKADAALEGGANGDWVSGYVRFAKAPLVIGFNPSSRFAAAFRTRPWYEVLASPGIRIGRTDPKLDPKGKLTVEAMTTAAAQLHRPELAKVLAAAAVFPEESLVGRLEAGQLDAGFFYANEATEQHIPMVALTPVKASATYTVAILRHARDPAGAAAFVAYLLGPQGRAALLRHGLHVLAPELSGSLSALPASLRALVRGG